MSNRRSLSEGAVDFISGEAVQERLDRRLAGPPPSTVKLDRAIAKSLGLSPLDLDETAALLAAAPEDRVRIHDAARALKRKVYGNRIVVFAPLYVGNRCMNDCTYCAFRRSSPDATRHTLSGRELAEEVAALEAVGHKRLILVFGEHRDYDAGFIADTVRGVTAVRHGTGEIRRVNVNAAPMDAAGFRQVKEAGIGTFQVFQETYHRETYGRVHPGGTPKSDWMYRLDAPGRAIDAGCDDVGIGALFGLYDWRFEVMGLVAHARHLQERHGVGPHTISFPRLQPARGVQHDERWRVSDDDFRHIVAVLRLAVPYTGLILTAREAPELRRDVLAFGVSQVDAGSRIDIGGYTRQTPDQPEREQFCLGDHRPLDAVLGELADDGYLPSFCTACYRAGRTGEHFMEFAIPGFIKRFCTPNAILSFTEYLEDYASPATRRAGARLVEAELAKMPQGPQKESLLRRLSRIREDGERDLYL